MRRIKLLAAMSILATAVVLIAGRAGQSQGPEASDPLLQPPGTAPTGHDPAPLLPAGPTGAAEPGAAPAQAHDAALHNHGGTLKPRISDGAWHAVGEGGYTYASSDDDYTWSSTPFHLPHGATLRYFCVDYHDRNPERNCDTFLTIYDLYGQIAEECGIHSSGAGMNYVTPDPLDHTVDCTYFSYVINSTPNDSGTGMQICGFRVSYDKP